MTPDLQTLHPIELGPLATHFVPWLSGEHYSRIVVLTDTNTNQYCLPLLKRAMPEGAQWSLITAPAGEVHKNITQCQAIWSAMFQAGLDRKSLVVNLGGGVIGDMGGFCAATYKRGIDFVQVPTTLLSATDAAIGGKLGIDFLNLKNSIGVFQQPAAVFIDPSFFDTLPERELRSGFAEVIKHALIGDPELWNILQGIHDLRQADWKDILPRSIAVKSKVVAQDPFEQGLRAVLNFGHTIGHAIESHWLNSTAPLTHGEAVAWGMLLESELAMRSGITLPERLHPRVLTPFLKRFYHFPSLDPQLVPTLWALMQQDKKNRSGRVIMTLPGLRPNEMSELEPDETNFFDLVTTAS
jgi:3-dehydroquinate synthase